MHPPEAYTMKAAARGRVRVSVIEAATGKVIEERPWQNNLILDEGLDMAGNYPWSYCIQNCFAGTGNTPTMDLVDGTYSQAGNTVTQVTGTYVFTSGDIGKLIKFDNGVTARITAVPTSTTATVTPSQTVTTREMVFYRVKQVYLTEQKRLFSSLPEFTWEDGGTSQGTRYDFPESLTIHRKTFDFAEESTGVNYTEIGLTINRERSISSATSTSTVLSYAANGHRLTVGETIVISGMSPSAYNGTFVVNTVPNANAFTVLDTSNPGASTLGGRLHARLFSRILLAGAVTVATGQLLRVKYELHLTTRATTPQATTGGITGWPLPYSIASITNSGSAWTATLTEAHHYVAGGQFNIQGAIRPKTAITAAASTGSDFTITAVGHGRSPGDVVLIEGMTPTGYNGRFTVATTPDADTFTVTSVLNPGTGTVFGTVRQQEPRGTVITAAASTADAFTITAVGHGLAPGDLVVVKGMTPTGYNGIWTVATTPTADTFTVTSTANPGTGTAFGDCYDNAGTLPWYDGRHTIDSVTSTTVVLSKTETPAAAGLGGTAVNNTNRTFKMLVTGFQEIATASGQYAHSGMNTAISGQPISAKTGALEIANDGGIYSGGGFNIRMFPVTSVTPPTGWPRIWNTTTGATPTGSGNETGLSSSPAGNSSGVGLAYYTPGNYYRDALVTFGAGAGNRNDILMLVIYFRGGFNGSVSSESNPCAYILFEERQRKRDTHKLDILLRVAWDRDLS